MRFARLAAAAVLVTGGSCGSADVSELPPAAEPRAAPPIQRAPAGRVVSIGPPLGELTAGGTSPPGGAPEGLVADPHSGVVAVGVRRPAQLVLVDGRGGRVRKRVPLPAGPRHLGLDARRGEVLVPAEAADRVLRISAASGRLTGTAPTGDQPHDVAEVAGRLFVGNERASTVTVLDGDRLLRTLPVATQPVGVTAAGDGELVAVVSARERVLEVFDARSLRRLSRVPAGLGPTHVVARGRWIWVTDTQADALLVFRLEPKLELVRRLPLFGGPYGIALDPARMRLWVTLTGRNLLAELPAHGRPHLLRTFPTVRQANGVAVDSRTGRVFVGGRADGVLQLLDPPPAP